MKKKISKYVLIGCGMMLCSLAATVSQTQAATYSSADNLALTISDTNSGQRVSHTLNIPDDITVGSMSVTLDIAHDWVGDLEIALTNPNGDYLLLVLTEADYNDNWNIFAVGEMYTFSDSALDYLPRSGDPRVGSDYIIPGNSYLPIASSRLDGLYSTFDASFSGQSAQGDWRLEIWDINSGYDGVLHSWQINLDGDTDQCLDAAVMATTYGLTSADAAFNRACDFDKDNDIDGRDLAQLM